MKQLADDAAELLPQEEAEGGKKRGRGRPKKDLRLVDALHQCWQGKVSTWHRAPPEGAHVILIITP